MNLGLSEKSQFAQFLLRCNCDCFDAAASCSGFGQSLYRLLAVTLSASKNALRFLP